MLAPLEKYVDENKNAESRRRGSTGEVPQQIGNESRLVWSSFGVRSFSLSWFQCTLLQCNSNWGWQECEEVCLSLFSRLSPLLPLRSLTILQATPQSVLTAVPLPPCQIPSTPLLFSSSWRDARFWFVGSDACGYGREMRRVFPIVDHVLLRKEFFFLVLFCFVSIGHRSFFPRSL
jgi:hypothetical protein